jgi:hypothetical protein
MTSHFFRIHNLRRKYSILYISLLKLMNIGIYYYGLSFFLCCDEMWKRKPKHSVTLSLYSFSYQLVTPAINLTL